MHHVSGYRRLFFVLGLWVWVVALGLWVWVVALVLGCVMDNCVCCGELLCFRDYCIVFGRCFVFGCFGRLKS